MTEFRAEDWGTARAEIVQRWPEHYQEAYGDDDYGLDLEVYDALAVAGQLLVVVARRAEVLVGYALAFVRPHLHQRHVLWGMVDMYWLQKECRGPRVFPRMMQAMEAEMKKLNVRRIFATEKHYGRVFAHLGYQASDERIFIKELE